MKEVKAFPTAVVGCQLCKIPPDMSYCRDKNCPTIPMLTLPKLQLLFLVSGMWWEKLSPPALALVTWLQTSAMPFLLLNVCLFQTG